MTTSTEATDYAAMTDREIEICIAEMILGQDRLLARYDPMNRNGEPQFHWGYPHGHDFAPSYCTDAASWLLLVEEMRKRWIHDCMWRFDQCGTDGWYVYVFRLWGEHQQELFSVFHPSLFRATCIAALRWMEANHG